MLLYPELHKPLDGVGGQSQPAGPDLSLSVPSFNLSRPAVSSAVLSNTQF